MRFLTSRFFHILRAPLSIPLWPFRIFSKIRGVIHEPMFITGVYDTGDKLFTGVNDIGDKSLSRGQMDASFHGSSN